MSGRISAREDPEDFEAWLNGDHELHDAQDVNGGDQEAQEAQETTVDPCWRSNMLVQVLLRAGQASPTHTFVYLDRYVLPVLTRARNLSYLMHSIVLVISKTSFPNCTGAYIATHRREANSIFPCASRYSQCLQTLRAREDMGEANQVRLALHPNIWVSSSDVLAVQSHGRMH